MFQHHSRRSAVLRIRGLSDEVLGVEDRAAEVHNFELTEEGTLRTVNGPVPYQTPVYSAGSGVTNHITGPIQGLVHHRLETGRDILLVQAAGTVFEHKGWNANSFKWDKLIGPLSSGYDWEHIFPSGRDRCFLTQFVATPQGVVIIPQNGGNYTRALFYDGDLVAPLGFADVPPAPEGHGPKGEIGAPTASNAFDDLGTIKGYHVSTMYPRDGLATDVRGLPAVFGPHRLGTTGPGRVSPSSGTSNPYGGELSRGEWRCRAQWVDKWGNKSALSPVSNGVACAAEENVTKDRTLGARTSADRLKIQAKWTVRNPPSDHAVIGTNLWRSRDLVNSGDAGFYQLLDYATASRLAEVTLPGSDSEVYPDNIPDAWLIREATEYEPVPEFKIACLALGRMWIGNVKGDPGRIMPSEPGLWGTFPANMRIYPDVRGEVTGLHAVPGGLLAFTESSTFFISENDAGSGFRVQSISTRVGCVSPNSIATMLNGAVVWLAREGFFGWVPGDQAPTELSMGFRRTARRINPQWRLRACAAVDTVRGEYRCWAPVDCSTYNNLCFVFDGVEWSTRDDVDVDAVCVTNDERQYMLAAGTARQSILDDQGDRSVSDYLSVYVLDHDGDGVYRSDHENREARIETQWFRAAVSHLNAGSTRLTLFLRETGNWKCKVEVFRDWRELAVETMLSSDDRAPNLYWDKDSPPFWGSAELGAVVRKRSLESATNPAGRDNIRWEARRPYWQKFDVYVPDCEVFKVRLTFTGDAEFIAIRYNEETSGAEIGEQTKSGGAR